MLQKRVSVMTLSPAELDKLNDQQCPHCGHEMEVVKLGGFPVSWTCHGCRTEYTTAR